MPRTCKYCQQTFENINPRVFSNHVRWCTKNITNGDKGKSKISSANKLPRITIEKQCKKCGSLFTVERIIKNGKPSISKKEKQYCCRSCGNSHHIVHSKETRQKISKALIKKETRIISCLYCDKEIITRNATKKFCSIKCARKFHFKDIDKTTKEYYRLQCNFQFALSDFPNEFDFELINQYGWYKAKNHGNNLNGISRDHIISVDYGFKNNIDPNIIRHPANCQLLRHNDNVSKNSKSSMTIEELKDKIDKWNKKYMIH